MKVFVDEVGYGSIAGPIFVCAVAIDDDMEKIPGVKDSKKISKNKREQLVPIIKSEVDYEYGSAGIQLIKEMNIHWARYEAMRLAIIKLMERHTIEEVIVDGKFEIPNLPCPQKAVIKADERYWQVGAASILAKVERDNMMTMLAETPGEFSHYDWENNAGYYTPKHRDGMIEYGLSSLHRRQNQFTKYGLFEHQEFVKSGKTFEEYSNWMTRDGRPKDTTRYNAWKFGEYDTWKSIEWKDGILRES